ncbi:hypothetical protein FS837_005439, partial [Tulasnella sp. UAMH 9824]
LFRLLDLCSETGSGGLVDKIIISQESLGQFINTVLPGAYTNITKIDLARLDREASLRLIGIYGSKSEIVQFLHSQGAIDDEVVALLLVEDDVSINMRSSLRSGIYVLSPPATGDSLAQPLVRYVIYWPEEATWNDAHEAELVFNETDQADDSDDGFGKPWNDDEVTNVDDRLFKFEVAKPNKQGEAVNMRPGLTVAHHAFCTSTAHIPTSTGSTRSESLVPRFVDSETVQAVATTRFVPGVSYTHRLDEFFSQYRFSAELTLDPEDLLPREGSSQPTDDLAHFYHVRATYKSADRAVEQAIAGAQFGSINYSEFRRLKKRFLIVKGMLEKHSGLSEEQRTELANAVSLNWELPSALKGGQAGWAKFNPLSYVKAVNLKLDLLGESSDEETLKAYSRVDEPSDTDFLKSLIDTVTKEPILTTSVGELRDLAQRGLRQTLESSAKALADKMISAQEREVHDTAKSFAKTRFATAKQGATSILRQAIVNRLFGEGKQPILTIDDVKPSRHWNGDFALKAWYNQRTEPTFETSVWSLDLSEDDRQRLKENGLHIPTPRMPRSPTTFNLPLGWRIRRLQILGSKQALLIVDCPDKIRLWVFPLRTGFSVDRPTCSIPNVHGRKYVVAVDEQMRLVALAITEPPGLVSLQEFLMDETFSTMHSRGSPLSLNSWYTDGIPEFTKIAFFSGSEELCLVEASGRVRVLSIPSRSFRPATVHLPTQPLYVRSSPDGAALLVVEGTQRGPKLLRVFHRASFSSNGNGIVKGLPESFTVTSNFCVSATGERSKAFLMAFDDAHQRIISSALEISRKETEYQFRAKDEANNTARETTTVHNSLTFVSSLGNYSFKGYFKRMVQDFERLSRKPTEQRLTRIVVDSSTFDELSCEVLSTSHYKAGEWVAELLCLIPIHIAVTMENRFVPLKDGVLDFALERQLLGAEVSKITNSISIGWYESIFREQTVGKSYTLNHMVDSSFGGSAVRTTE